MTPRVAKNQSRGTERKRSSRGGQKKGRTVDQLKREAKAVGAVGGNLKMSQRRLRNSAIAAAALEGQSTKAIAAEFELTDRAVRKILEDRQNIPTGLDQRPMELIEQFVREHWADIADLRGMALAYGESHPPVALGAKTRAMEARERLLVILGQLGKLPDNLETLRSNETIRQILDYVYQQLVRVRQGELTIDEMFRVLEEQALGETVDATPARRELGSGA